MTDIEIATDDELLAELHRRYPTFVLVTEREAMGAAEKKITERAVQYRGGISAAIGLLMIGGDYLRDYVAPDEWVQADEDEGEAGGEG